LENFTISQTNWVTSLYNNNTRIVAVIQFGKGKKSCFLFNENFKVFFEIFTETINSRRTKFEARRKYRQILEICYESKISKNCEEFENYGEFRYKGKIENSGGRNYRRNFYTGTEYNINYALNMMEYVYFNLETKKVLARLKLDDYSSALQPQKKNYRDFRKFLTTHLELMLKDVEVSQGKPLELVVKNGENGGKMVMFESKGSLTRRKSRFDQFWININDVDNEHVDRFRDGFELKKFDFFKNEKNQICEYRLTFVKKIENYKGKRKIQNFALKIGIVSIRANFDFCGNAQFQFSSHQKELNLGKMKMSNVMFLEKNCFVCNLISVGELTKAMLPKQWMRFYYFGNGDLVLMSEEDPLRCEYSVKSTEKQLILTVLANIGDVKLFGKFVMKQFRYPKLPLKC
jgi:hypothetical protein